MARIHLAIDTRYARGGHVYRVRQILLDGAVLVENQSVGGQEVVARDELTAAWARGEVTFEIHGPHTRSHGTVPLATASTIGDLAGLPDARRAEAWRRYQVIAPLLARPPHERTRQAIAAYAATLTASSGADTDQRVSAGPISRGSIERYLRAYEQSGGDLRALVPATERRGAPGHSRLDPDAEHIVQGVLAMCAAAPAYRTSRDVYYQVVTRIRDANASRVGADPIPLPSAITIYRRVRAAGAATILRRRKSRTEAHAEADVQPGPRPDHILQRVELDHTPLDLILVDEEDRLPIGRPTVTLALDVYSGFPTGVYVGFEPASYAAAMRGLLHSILPKEDVQARYGTRHPWPAYGLPDTLVVDHAPHLVGPDLSDACGQLSIHLAPAPVYRPWFKGAIERQFRTHNTGLVHTLPGTTFSTLLQRGDYASERHACLTLTRFWEILHVYLLDLYAQEHNRGVGGIPAVRWAQSLAAGVAPALHHDAGEVRILLGRTARRTLQRTGIDLHGLRYQSLELGALRHRWATASAATIKYDPEDLGAIHVRDTTDLGAPSWLRVPAVDQAYARGLSLWKHRLIQAYVRHTLQQEIDVYALAAAKERIQTIVDEEFRRTRQVTRRRTLARAKGIGLPHDAGTREPVHLLPHADHDRGRTTDPAGAHRAAVPDVLPADAPGFGGDYNLPR